MTDEPRLQAEPREGVPDVIDTLPAFREYYSALASSHGSLAADAERASGFRYGHDDWLVQFKRDGLHETRPTPKNSECSMAKERQPSRYARLARFRRPR